jgi:hypothetical protein
MPYKSILQRLTTILNETGNPIHLSTKNNNGTVLGNMGTGNKKESRP